MIEDIFLKYLLVIIFLYICKVFHLKTSNFMKKNYIVVYLCLLHPVHDGTGGCDTSEL